ncbi:MAG: AraC family transcriptional regulator [Synergistales bacterium]|nr:AraC family transcriptional regulator [Synergistales bacterium]
MEKNGDTLPGRSGKNRTRFWRSEYLPGVLFLDGTYLDMKFTRHSHETYAFGVIESGALAFRYRGEDVVASEGMLGMVVPGEVHDGHPALGRGWRYRMAYADPGAVRAITRGLWGKDRGLPFIGRGVLEARDLAGIFRRLYEGLQGGAMGSLTASSLWTAFISGLFGRFGEYPAAVPRASRGSVRAACAFLRENMTRNISLDELAALSSLSPWHFLRTFRDETGLPPHAYLTQLRVRKAERLLRAGHSPSMAAAEAGFADQSHLTRWFRRIVGATPAAFLKEMSPAGARHSRNEGEDDHGQ